MMMNSSRVILFAVVLLVLLGLTTHSTYAGSGDEPHYLAIAHSIAFDLDFDVSNNYGAAEPLIADGQLQPEDHARAGRGGVLRPVHDVGMPLLLAPVVRHANAAGGTEVVVCLTPDAYAFSDATLEDALQGRIVTRLPELHSLHLRLTTDEALTEAIVRLQRVPWVVMAEGNPGVRTTLAHAREVGCRLHDAKAPVGHGGWTGWR